MIKTDHIAEEFILAQREGKHGDGKETLHMQEYFVKLFAL